MIVDSLLSAQALTGGALIGRTSRGKHLSAKRRC